MKMNRYKLLFLAIFIISCNNDEHNGSILADAANATDPLLGKWYKHHSTYYYENDGNPYNQYRPYHDIDNYYSSFIIDITADSMKFIFNVDTSSVEGELSSYMSSGSEYAFVTDSTLSFPQPDVEDILLIMPMYVQNDTLIWIVMEAYDDDGTLREQDINYYARYDGAFPPDSWMTSLENDAFEPDNTQEQVQNFSLIGEERIQVLRCNDKDYFTVDADPAYEYTITVKSNLRIILFVAPFSDGDADDDRDGIIEENIGSGLTSFSFYISNDHCNEFMDDESSLWGGSYSLLITSTLVNQ